MELFPEVLFSRFFPCLWKKIEIKHPIIYTFSWILLFLNLWLRVLRDSRRIWAYIGKISWQSIMCIFGQGWNIVIINCILTIQIHIIIGKKGRDFVNENELIVFGMQVKAETAEKVNFLVKSIMSRWLDIHWK